MSRSPVRFGLVGYGAWGRHHAQAIAQHPEAELVAIATPSETSRAAAANAHPDARIFGGHAHGNSRDPQRPQLFDNFSAMFRHANGAHAVVSQTLAAFEHHQTVKVAGMKGAIWAGWSGALDRALDPASFLKVFDGHELRNVELPKPSGEVFELREQIGRCVAMARGGAPPAASGRDGLWSAGLCLLAEESIRQKRSLPVDEMLKML